MKKLDKAQSKQKDDLFQRLEKEGQKLENALNDYNCVIAEINSFMSDMREKMEEYQSEKSEKWQEGDKGEAYSNWISSWENELEEADIDLSTNLDTFQELTEEPEG